MNIYDARGTRFLDELRHHLLPIRQEPRPRITERDVLKDGQRMRIRPGTDAHTWFAYHQFLDDLDDPNTQRLLFDARQAAQFDSLIAEGATPGQDLRAATHAPFNKLYIEFTEPLYIDEGEPEHSDLLRAILFEDNVMEVGVPDPRVDHLMPNEYQKMECAQVAVFLTERNPVTGNQTYVDRTFKFNLQTGLAFIPGASMRSKGIGIVSTGVDTTEGDALDPSDMPHVRDHETGESRPVADEEYCVVGMGAGNEENPRYMGWFERTINRYSDLLTYIFAYTSAKSMRVVEAPLTRQEKRWHHRNNTLPRPWHVIEVDPKFYRPGEMEEGEGSKHGYRYDVIGHFRAGRYKLGDGTYRHHISWVPPHQRGLANALYIPALHNVKGGKVISPIMKQVYGHAEELGAAPPEPNAVSEE
jgi:hypothetical protein